MRLPGHVFECTSPFQDLVCCYDRSEVESSSRELAGGVVGADVAIMLELPESAAWQVVSWWLWVVLTSVQVFLVDLVHAQHALHSSPLGGLQVVLVVHRLVV